MPPTLYISVPFWIVMIVVSTLIVIGSYLMLRVLGLDRSSQAANETFEYPNPMRSTERILAHIDSQRSAMTSADAWDATARSGTEKSISLS